MINQDDLHKQELSAEYDKGYQDGRASAQDEIEALLLQISDLELEIDSMLAWNEGEENASIV